MEVVLVSVPRVLAVIGLLVVGIVLLPLLASFLDGEGTENLILPIHLVVMAVLGALVWRALPPAPDSHRATTSAGTTSGGPAVGERTSSARLLLAGAVVGVAAGVVALLLFFVLLSGFDGA
jgi:hypothetical protein